MPRSMRCCLALLEALLIVTFVVFAFLGSPRSVLIPVVAIPLSLIGAFAMMLAFGFSINLLTLLALVLAIGLVVDDAIIVVENVNRHLDEGPGPSKRRASRPRELGGPIIAMTVVLIAVYVPIGFQSGLTGALFTEFAFTLAGAVTISAIVALTLTPMLCSRFLKPIDRAQPNWEGKLVGFIDRRFDEVHRIYTRMLSSSLDTLPVTIVFAAIILCSISFLAHGAKSELAPQEDQGAVIFSATSAPNATMTQRAMWDSHLNDILLKFPKSRIRSRSTCRARRLWSVCLNHGISAADRPIRYRRLCRRSANPAMPASRSPPSSCRRCPAPGPAG